MPTQLVNSSEQLNDKSGGWIPTSDNITFLSADSPSYLVSVGYNTTGTYGVGMKFQLTHQNQTKNFFITQVTLTGTSTYLNLYGGTDYTLNITGSISSVKYSWEKTPYGFPTSPTKWTVTLTDTSSRTQATPSGSVYYNPGSLSISIPIGLWNVSYRALSYILFNGDFVTAGACPIYIALSTSNNSASDSDLITKTFIASVNRLNAVHQAGKIISLTSKTSYYMNCMTDAAGINTIGMLNNQAQLVVAAVCAYL